MPDRILYEQHMHTPLCNHAECDPEQYAAVAERRGLAGIVVTDHNPMPDSYGHSGRMAEDQVDEYFALVDRARRAFAGRVDVRIGMECDYFPGYESYVEKQLNGMPYHHVLGSVHCHLPIWRRRFATGSPLETQRNYFNHIAEAAETQLFDTMSHPDLIKNMTADDWDLSDNPRPPGLLDIIRAALDRVAATGVAMELNTSGLLKHIPEMNPAPRILAEMRARRIPVAVGADAHAPERVADHFEQAYDLLEAAGYTHVSYFLDRQRHEISLPTARASLTPYETADTR